MDTDRLVFLFICVVSFLVYVIATPTNSKKAKYYGELNGSCRVNDDCGNFGYICSNNKTCQCGKQYKANYPMKVCLGGIDQKCQYDEHCIEGAYCMNQSICQCKDTWPFVSEDGLECTNGVSQYLLLQNNLKRIFLFLFLLVFNT